jgi:hypothetical protein
MTGFDAELYLRLSGERSLVRADERGATLLDHARALVAVNAVDTGVAQRVVDDYATARRLRTGGHHHRPNRTKQPPAAPIAARRTVPCGVTFTQEWGSLKVRSISLSASGVRVAVLLHPAVRGGLDEQGFSTPQLTVTDEHGTAVSPGFSGGGSPDEWRGHYSSDQSLAFDTRWVEILGQRIDLVDRTASATVRIESLAELDPAERYLTHCLEQTSQRRRRGVALVDDAVAALIACGALAQESALATDTIEVANGLQRGLGPASPTLPARWRSLITSRGRTGGPVARQVIGAVTPVFSGVSAVVSELESTDEEFAIEVDIDGAINAAGHFDDDVDPNDLTYAATDDLGNHYLGGLGGWSGGDSGLQGQVDFRPALDPNARQLDLILSGNHERAVISVALDWDERS